MRPWDLLTRTWYCEWTQLTEWLTTYVRLDQAEEVAARVMTDMLVKGIKGVNIPRGVTYELYLSAYLELLARGLVDEGQIPVTWRRTIPLPRGPRSLRLATAYALVRALALHHHASPWEVYTASRWLLQARPPERGLPALSDVPGDLEPITQLWRVLSRLVGDADVSIILLHPSVGLLLKETEGSQYSWVDNQRYVRKETAGERSFETHNPCDAE